MVNLKPCPFCGAKENLLDLDHSRFNRFFVCTTCGARGPLSAWHDPDHAAKLWNRRAVDDRIEKLEAEVTRWRDRYADVMAKLAQADELLERAMNFPPSRRSQTMCNFYPQMKAILSDKGPVTVIVMTKEAE
jgi:Lar family restriction alleviation protein